MKVLLVEADAELRESLAALLCDANMIVFQAGNVSGALQLAQNIGDRDLLIIDQDLGSDMTGFDLAGRIRERRPLAPLILMSRNPLTTQAFAIGPYGRLLGMPFGADCLFRLIREVTDIASEDSVASAASTHQEDGEGDCGSASWAENSPESVRLGWLPIFRWGR